MKSYDYCPQCKSDVDDLIETLGICERCAETPAQRSERRKWEAQEAFDSGRPMSPDDY